MDLVRESWLCPISGHRVKRLDGLPQEGFFSDEFMEGGFWWWWDAPSGSELVSPLVDRSRR